MFSSLRDKFQKPNVGCQTLVVKVDYFQQKEVILFRDLVPKGRAGAGLSLCRNMFPDHCLVVGGNLDADARLEALGGLWIGRESPCLKLFVAGVIVEQRRLE